MHRPDEHRLRAILPSSQGVTKTPRDMLSQNIHALAYCSRLAKSSRSAPNTGCTHCGWAAPSVSRGGIESALLLRCEGSASAATAPLDCWNSGTAGCWGSVCLCVIAPATGASAAGLLGARHSVPVYDVLYVLQ